MFDLRFTDPRLAEGFTFRPGQFVELSVLGVGEGPFSLPSSPTRRGLLPARHQARRRAHGLPLRPHRRGGLGRHPRPARQRFSARAARGARRAAGGGRPRHGAAARDAALPDRPARPLRPGDPALRHPQPGAGAVPRGAGVAARGAATPRSCSRSTPPRGSRGAARWAS